LINSPDLKLCKANHPLQGFGFLEDTIFYLLLFPFDMNETEFWNLIETTKKKSKGDPEEQIRLLTENLTKRSVEAIVSFDDHLDRYRSLS